MCPHFEEETLGSHSVNLRLRDNLDATNLGAGRGGIAFPPHSLGVMEMEMLVRKNEETKIACENRGVIFTLQCTWSAH